MCSEIVSCVWKWGEKFTTEGSMGLLEWGDSFKPIAQDNSSNKDKSVYVLKGQNMHLEKSYLEALIPD